MIRGNNIEHNHIKHKYTKAKPMSNQISSHITAMCEDYEAIIIYDKMFKCGCNLYIRSKMFFAQSSYSVSNLALIKNFTLTLQFQTK